MDTKHVIYRITKQINAKLGRVHWPVQLPGVRFIHVPSILFS